MFTGKGINEYRKSGINRRRLRPFYPELIEGTVTGLTGQVNTDKTVGDFRIVPRSNINASSNEIMPLTDPVGSSVPVSNWEVSADFFIPVQQRQQGGR